MDPQVAASLDVQAGSDEEFVERAFREVLRRPVDDESRTRALVMLADGTLSRSTFLHELVTAPEAASVEDALYFRRRLQELGMPFGGYVVNRLHPERPPATDEGRRLAAQALEAAMPADEAARLLAQVEAGYEQERMRGERDRRTLDRLAAERTRLVGIPRLEGDISDVHGLAQLRHVLTSMGVLVVPQGRGISAAHTAFDDEGRLKDRAQQAAIEAIAQRLVDLVRRHAD